MLEVQLTMQGIQPLIVHSDRSVNPLDPLVRELAKFTGKRKKTEDDHEMVRRIEFELGLYWDEENGPYLPTGNIHKALVEGARQSKLGKSIEQGTFALDVRAPILYDGPRDIEGLYEEAEHRYTVSVGVGQKRVMRTRPRFPVWAATTAFAIDPEKVDVDIFTAIAEVTGRYIGIGERRPNKGGPFGVFTPTVELLKGGKFNGRAVASTEMVAAIN